MVNLIVLLWRVFLHPSISLSNLIWFRHDKAILLLLSIAWALLWHDLNLSGFVFTAFWKHSDFKWRFFQCQWFKVELLWHSNFFNTWFGNHL